MADNVLTMCGVRRNLMVVHKARIEPVLNDTKEPVVLKVGMTVRDNDQRTMIGPHHRDRIVQEILGDRVSLIHPTLGERIMTHVSITRIFTDNKPRESGWSVVA